MEFTYNINSKQFRLTFNNGFSSSSSNLNRITSYFTEHTTFKNTQKLKLEKINKIKEFFCFEYDQVDNILQIIWNSKLKQYPLGMTYDIISEKLKNKENNIFENLFKSSSSYLLSLLNTLSLPNIQVLEIRPHDGSFDLTAFGVEYYIENYKKTR